MTSRHPDALVFALCHEVGNLLTAMRLRADALRPGSEVAPAAAAISALATRSAALLAQIRPLIAGPEAGAGAPPALVLERLARDLADVLGERVQVEDDPLGALPEVACDAELLHQLLLAAALAAAEAASESGALRLRAEAAADRLRLVVEHDASERPFHDGPRPSGLALVRAAADEILGRLGGRCTWVPGRIDFELPATPPCAGTRGGRA